MMITPQSQPTTSNPKAKMSSCFETPKSGTHPEKTQTKISNPKRKKTSIISIPVKNLVKTLIEMRMQLQ